MSTQQEPQPSALRYPLAMLACAGVAAVAAAVLVGVGWVIFERLSDWIDRQVWVVRFPLQCLAGLVLLVVIGTGWEAVKGVWNRITLGYEARAAGQTHGRHARWRPGYDPKAEEAQASGEHGRCPKCGFSYGWNGTGCSHCGFGMTDQPD